MRTALWQNDWGTEVWRDTELVAIAEERGGSHASRGKWPWKAQKRAESGIPCADRASAEAYLVKWFGAPIEKRSDDG